MLSALEYVPIVEFILFYVLLAGIWVGEYYTDWPFEGQDHCEAKKYKRKERKGKEKKAEAA
jgi:hypothetical protein